jgi:uncharacterized membrane protein
LFKDKSIQKKILRIGLFIFSAIWILGIAAPGFDLFTSLYPFQKQLYSTVCHQNISKSFICNDMPFLVCARCTGIYAGTIISAFILIGFSKNFIFKTKYLIILAAPLLLDVIFLTFSFYSYNKYLSSFTGVLFGSSVFLYILSAIENLLFTKQKVDDEPE